MAGNNQVSTQTSTQIRNMYSDNMAYMNIKFFNTNLSFQLYPFQSKDETGRSKFDMQHGQMTTVNFEGAFSLYQASKDIIDGKIRECNLLIPCANGATLTLERKMGMNNIMETYFTINKNNVIIPFKFMTQTYNANENGQNVQKVIECGLGAFMKTIEGYLTGINADRHLDKLTEEFVKAQSENGNNQNSYSSNNNSNNNGYRSNNYNKGNSNNRGNYNYRKNYYNNNNNSNGNNNGFNDGSRQQNMSTYNIPN